MEMDTRLSKTIGVPAPEHEAPQPEMLASALRQNRMEQLPPIEDINSPVGMAVRTALPKQVQALIAVKTSQVLSHDRALGKEETYAAGAKDKVLYERVTRHLQAEEKVRMLGSDVTDSLDKSMRSAQALSNLEQRILNLRQMLRQQDATADPDKKGSSGGGGKAAGGTGGAGTVSGLVVGPPGSIPSKAVSQQPVKTSVDLVEEELKSSYIDRGGMEDCPKCGRLFMLGFLRRHLEECEGAGGGADSDSQDTSDDSDAEGDGTSAKALAQRNAALAKQRGNMSECPVCVRKFAKHKIEAHVHGCRLKENRRMAKAAAAAKRELDPATVGALRANATAPKAPLKVRHLAVGPTTVPLLWEAPLYDGGAPILEYEIEYSMVTFTKVNRRETRREEILQPIVSTTRWANSTPVSNRGWNLTGLPGDTELVNVRVRALNEKGRSDWSEPLKSVRTLPAVPPTPPLMLALATQEDMDTMYAAANAAAAAAAREDSDQKHAPPPVLRAPITSNSFTVTWESPIDDGGDKVEYYEVRYTAQMPDFDATLRARALSGGGKTSSNSIVTSGYPRTVRLPAVGADSRCGVTVPGLRGNTAHTDIKVVAITASGLISAPALAIPLVKTLPMTRTEELQYELAEKQGMSQVDVPVIDGGGVMQMVNRQVYIRQCEDELAELTAAVAGGRSESEYLSAQAAAKAGPVNTNSLNTGLTAAAEKESMVRKKHFQHRMGVLQGRIDELSDAMYRCQERRTQLKTVLVQADRRWRILTAENEHVKNFKGKYIDSAVMHGRSQRFLAASLLGMILDELEEVSVALYHGKREMIEVVDEGSRLKEEKERIEAQLKERKAAFLAFEKEEARKMRAAKFAARINAAGMFRCFATWKAMVETRKAAKARLKGFGARWSNAALNRGFRKWWGFVLHERRREKLSTMKEVDDMMPGLGSSLLLAAEKQRSDASEDATALLSWLRKVEYQLDAAEVSLTYRRRIKDPDIAIIQPRGGPSVRAAAAASALAIRAQHGEGALVAPLVPITQPMSASTDINGDVLAVLAPVLRMVDGPVASQEARIAGSTVHGKSEAQMAADITGEAHWEQFLQDQGQRKILEEKGPDAINEGALKEQVEAHARALLARGEAYMRSGEHERSLLALKRAEMVYGWRKDARGLLAVYRLLSTLLERVGRFDLGIVHWDRCLQMAREHDVSDVLAAAEAYEGRGRCLSARQSHEDALLAFERAEDIHTSRDDQPAIARLLRMQAGELDMLFRPGKARELRTRADTIQSALSTLVASGLARLIEMENELIGIGLANSRLTQLEAVGPAVPLLRQQERFLEMELQKMRAIQTTTRQVLGREERRYTQLKEEADRAEGTDARNMSSSLLSGVEQVYEINELRLALRAEQNKVGETMEEARRENRAFELRINNLQEELTRLGEYLVAETRELSRLAHAKKPLRVVAINSINTRTNNVLGSSAGGVSRVAAALEQQVYAYSTLDGACLTSFVGDSERNPLGQPVGHTKVITCIAYCGSIIYTGSQDCTIRAWDADLERGYGKKTPIEVMLEAEERGALGEAQARQDAEAAEAEANGQEYTRKALVIKGVDPQDVRRLKAGQLMVFEGHTGTVTCIAADTRLVISGSADRTTIVWNALTGELLRKLRGHEYAVSCLSLDERSFATGGADWEVRLWRITKASKRKPARIIQMAKKCKGHIAPVTCVCLQGYDLVSGASNGEIIVWDIDTGMPLKKHQVHTLGRPVFCLQFDAVKIISAGADSKLVFTDIITGEAIQTAQRPHGDAHVLALSFDTDRLLTVGADRSMRVWAFKGADPVPMVKLHVLKPGEKLPMLGKKYGVRVRDLMRWNGVHDQRDFYEGMRIVVAPPPGSEAFEEMAAAEAAAAKVKEEEEEVRRRQALAEGREATEGRDVAGSDEAVGNLLKSILHKAKEGEDTLLAIQDSQAKEKKEEAKRKAAGLAARDAAANKRASVGVAEAGAVDALNAPSSMAAQVHARAARKVPAQTNVWKGQGGEESQEGQPITGLLDAEGNVTSTTVGAAVHLPGEGALLAKAMKQPVPRSALQTINPSPSPFVRRGSAQTAVTDVSTVSKGADGLMRHMLGGEAGAGLQMSKGKTLRSMAAAHQMRVSVDSSTAQAMARSTLSAQVESATTGHEQENDGRQRR